MSKNSYIRLGKQNRDFAVLPNQLLRDKGLSFRDIGILASILSHDPTWLVHVWEMSRPRESREGPHAVRSSLKRLRSIGYVSLVLERQPNGTLHSVYYVYSNPKDNDQPDVLFGSIKPNTEKRHQVKMQTAPDAEKRYPVNLQNTPDGVSPDAVQPDSGKRNAARPDAVNRHAKEVPSLRSIDSTKKQQQKAMTENAKAEKTKIAAVAAVVVQLEKTVEEGAPTYYSRAELDRYATHYAHSPSALAKIDAVRRNNRRVAFLPKELSQLACEDLEARK